MHVFLIYAVKQNQVVACVQHRRDADPKVILLAWLYSQGLRSESADLYRVDMCPVTMWQSLVNAVTPVSEIGLTSPEQIIVLNHAGGMESFVFNIQKDGKVHVKNIYEHGESEEDRQGKHNETYSSPLEALLATASKQCGWL